ncbi:MAG: haloacid dehalogenase type II [Pseudomonadota bacterium]|nr:haloacid dehalogenase type II [Pseudomonadota bacterium]
MRLSDFRILTFDCYGTLIDWEAGIWAALQPLLRARKSAVTREEALEAFGRHETAQEAETPTLRYSDLLARVHARLAKEWDVDLDEGEHSRFGRSVPDWPAFPDSAEALGYLKRHYKLVILSNVDRESFKGSNAKLGVTFDAIHTAEDIGSYKPDPRNFEYLLNAVAKQGFAPADILHTAQSLFHDHVPAKRFGLATAWIDRRHEQTGWGATPPAEGAACDFRFNSLGEMTEAHRREIQGAA